MRGPKKCKSKSLEAMRESVAGKFYQQVAIRVALEAKKHEMGAEVFMSSEDFCDFANYLSHSIDDGDEYIVNDEQSRPVAIKYCGVIFYPIWIRHFHVRYIHGLKQVPGISLTSP